MRKLIGSVLIAAGLTASLITPAGAITGNFVPDTQHPFVGLVVFYDADGEFLSRCSGSLLTQIVFLTAGHCTDASDGAVTARVYFQQDAGASYNPETELDPITGYPEFCADGTLGVTCATSDELYNFGFADFEGFPDTGDVGLVILDQRIELAEYGALAAPGSLDAFATKRGQRRVTFTVSGYGLTYSSPSSTVSFRSRLMATSYLVNLTSANAGGFNLQTTNNPGRGGGGTCFGDSGGPVFYGGFASNVIVGVTSFGFGFNRSTCGGVDFAYRTDTVAVITWILETVPDSEADDIQIVEI